MLGKLLKYEIPAMGRKLLPLFIAWLASSVLLGLSLGGLQGSGFFEILAPLVYAMVTTAVFVMFIILIIQRYNSSMLGDEAYFNLTLPVSTNMQIANKAISALIWTVITGLVALLSLLVIAISAGNFFRVFNLEVWRDIILDIFKVPGTIALVTIQLVIVVTFSIVKSILAVYAAITIGHQASHRTTLASIGAYIVLMIIESSIGSVMVRIGIITDAQLNLAEAMSDMAVFNTIMIISFLATLALSAFYFFICKYLMEKRLNLS